MNQNIFWHYGATGSGQTVSMPDNKFSKSAQGGSFYKSKTGDWYCCGAMERGAGKATFKVWIDDKSTKTVTEGVQQGQPFKLLVYDLGQWFEIIPDKVRLAFGGDNVWTRDLFNAKAWNMMIVPDSNMINLAPIELVPMVNVDLLNGVPEIIGAESYTIQPGARKIVIKNDLRWCEFAGFTADYPAGWTINRVGKTNDLVIHVYNRVEMVEPITIWIYAKPFKADSIDIEKIVEVRW